MHSYTALSRPHYVTITFAIRGHTRSINRYDYTGDKTIPGTLVFYKVPLRDRPCLGEWRKNELKKRPNI